MLKVGLTGGTGAGKSTVAAHLSRLGAVVVDADRLAREVLAPGSEGLAAVVAEFGADVLTAEGSLDRKALADLVFRDPARRQALERLTHPRIAARTAELLAATAPDAVVVHDVPLLVEKQMAPRYHLVVVVHAPDGVRVRRLVEHRGMGEDDARARIAAQADDEQRRAVADVWLDNSGDPEDLEAPVERLWHDRLLPYERNLRARRPAEARHEPCGDLPVGTAERHHARLAAVVESVGGSARQVGVLPVAPGVDDVARRGVQLRVTVPSATGADQLVEPLAEAGFPVLEPPAPLSRADVPGLVRVHGSADPGACSTVWVGVG